MEAVAHIDGFLQLGILLGMLAMTLCSLAAFTIYLFVLPSSIQVYAPLLDAPPLPAPKAAPAPGAVLIPAQTISGA